MDLIILTDGVYHLIPVTKAMLADMALFSNVNCFDLCDILRMMMSQLQKLKTIVLLLC